MCSTCIKTVILYTYKNLYYRWLLMLSKENLGKKGYMTNRSDL